MNIITTIAGDTAEGYGGDGGPAINAVLDIPSGIVVDKAGNVYFGDAEADIIRMISTSGTITAFAGNVVGGFSGDGGQATSAMIDNPLGLAIDTMGNIYFADFVNNRVRKVNTSGIITTIAGTGTGGYSGDNGAAILAQLNAPGGVAVDRAGNIYIAEISNNCIRKINTAGIITTIVGNGVAGYSGDGGQASLAKLNQPNNLILDNTGNIYIADTYNNVIRKINTTGIISTIAGNGTAGYSGDWGAAITAQLFNPIGLAFDAAGNLYFAEATNNIIRQITTAGTIYTFAGTGDAGFSGDGGPAIAAEMEQPFGIAIDGAGNMYITDSANDRMRRTTNVTGINTFAQLNENVIVYPNPTTNYFQLTFSNANTKPINISLYNSLGVEVKHESEIETINQTLKTDVSSLPSGIYNLNILSNKGVLNKTIIIAK